LLGLGYARFMKDIKKIIIVDNHPVILKYMTDLLEKQGHRVKTAKNSLSGLKIIDTWIPDAMFIDMFLPLNFRDTALAWLPYMA